MLFGMTLGIDLKEVRSIETLLLEARQSFWPMFVMDEVVVERT
jgi:hypothetical protein